MADSPPVSTLLDVIVLCFAKSELKALVGADAFRRVLEGKQREIFPEVDTIALQPIWELLESQTGFDKRKALAPVCRIKNWEAKLGVRVEMPSKLGVFDESTREKLAVNCYATDKDLENTLKPPTAQTPIPLKRALTTGTMKAVSGDVPRTTQTGSMRRLTPLPIPESTLKKKLAIAAAVIGVTAALISAYFTFRGGDTVARLSTTEISEKVPLSEVRINGKVIAAKLSDPKWLDKPEVERRLELEATLPAIQAKQATKLLLLDAKGAPVATVSVKGRPPVVFHSQR